MPDRDADRATDVVPIFPLPNVVFFPQTVLPLHVFEARYRQMVRDAAAGERRIAVTLLRGDWRSTYAGAPPIHRIATVGRIEDLVSLPDGRFDLKLVGLQRVRLTEIPSSKLYRLARAEPALEPDAPAGDETERAKVDLLASHGYLLREITDGPEGHLVLDDTVPFRDAVNRVCANLPVEPAARQELLEVDDLAERRQLAHALVGELLQRVLFLKSLPGDAPDEPVN